ncbi:MAG TPA: hypothetical protein VL866_12555, partial [Pyrinomonadaceae bacterium]|nr:hypothetical protein [Pyrinomonadaceae bacterium]
ETCSMAVWSLRRESPLFISLSACHHTSRDALRFRWSFPVLNKPVKLSFPISALLIAQHVKENRRGAVDAEFTQRITAILQVSFRYLLAARQTGVLCGGLAPIS